MQEGPQLALEDGDKWPNAAGSIVWLVQASDGWVKVWAEHAEAIETGIAANRNPVECSHTTYAGKGQKTTNYQYDWKAMTQRNTQSGTKCTLKRARYYPEPPNPPSAAWGASGWRRGWGLGLLEGFGFEHRLEHLLTSC